MTKSNEKRLDIHTLINDITKINEMYLLLSETSSNISGALYDNVNEALKELNSVIMTKINILEYEIIEIKKGLTKWKTTLIDK